MLLHRPAASGSAGLDKKRKETYHQAGCAGPVRHRCIVNGEEYPCNPFRSSGGSQVWPSFLPPLPTPRSSFANVWLLIRTLPFGPKFRARSMPRSGLHPDTSRRDDFFNGQSDTIQFVALEESPQPDTVNVQFSIYVFNEGGGLATAAFDPIQPNPALRRTGLASVTVVKGDSLDHFAVSLEKDTIPTSPSQFTTFHQRGFP